MEKPSWRSHWTGGGLALVVILLFGGLIWLSTPAPQAVAEIRVEGSEMPTFAHPCASDPAHNCVTLWRTR